MLLKGGEFRRVELAGEVIVQQFLFDQFELREALVSDEQRFLNVCAGCVCQSSEQIRFDLTVSNQ
ncbi:MAG: hypothetical protein HY011_32365 [Acidobacteria bacterium]|nr:hypothetical protein [Acidobacteriota bacterium]